MLSTNNDKVKICLFTTYSPLIGSAGGVLNSLIENLTEIHIEWYYLNENIVIGHEENYLGVNLKNNNILKDIYYNWKMLSNKNCPDSIEQTINKLLKIECESYWIISHQEGLRIALELSKRQNTKPVHVSFHDDWAGAICARSFRYRFLSYWAKKTTIATIKQINSFDVISKGMQNYYQEISGLKGEICHRYLSAESLITPKNVNSEDHLKVLNIGHVGSLYANKEFIAFLSLVKAYANLSGRKLQVHMWGSSRFTGKLPIGLKNCVKFYGQVPDEKEIIMGLSKCTFVYTMYPMTKNLRLFSTTSLPSKLTSYVQAGKPIFGHCPKESTLSEFITSTQIGATWNSLDHKTGFKTIDKILSLTLQPQHWEFAREKYFGENNLNVLKNLFH